MSPAPGGTATSVWGGSGDKAASPTSPQQFAHPQEWIYLSREAYCAMKGRCCRSTAFKLETGLLVARDAEPRKASDYGTPLEAALDAAVVICEAFEDVGQSRTSKPVKCNSGMSSANDLLVGGGFGAAALKSRKTEHGTCDDVSTSAIAPHEAGQMVDASAAALHKWLDLHAPLLRSALRKRSSGERLELYPSPALPELAAGLASLFDEGAVITIDYGADAATLINSGKRIAPFAATNMTQPPKPTTRSSAGLRVRSRLPCEPGMGATLALSRPGWSDLTTDVNFTELAAVGESHGLRTVFFGPQTGLQRTLHNPDFMTAPPPPRVTDAKPSQRVGVLDAFYSLGSFVMLVQASPSFAPSWSLRQASQPLFGAGHASLGAMALMHTLRTLGRLILEHALALPEDVPTERELVAALADALIPTVPCFKTHWRKMASAVLRLIAERKGRRDAAALPDSLPPLYRNALALVAQDLDELAGVAPGAS